jgi:hypothetical protein
LLIGLGTVIAGGRAEAGAGAGHAT